MGLGIAAVAMCESREAWRDEDCHIRWVFGPYYWDPVLDGAAGSFRADYAAKLTELKKVVVANRTRSSVKQVEAGLVSADLDSAEVIVGLVAPTSNTATTTAIDKTYRLRLDLQRTSDARSPWKVTGLDFVG